MRSAYRRKSRYVHTSIQKDVGWGWLGRETECAYTHITGTVTIGVITEVPRSKVGR